MFRFAYAHAVLAINFIKRGELLTAPGGGEKLERKREETLIDVMYVIATQNTKIQTHCTKTSVLNGMRNLHEGNT